MGDTLRRLTAQEAISRDCPKCGCSSTLTHLVVKPRVLCIHCKAVFLPYAEEAKRGNSVKRIVFTVVDNGQDGRGPRHDVFASLIESEQIDWYNGHVNKNYYSLEERIVDTEVASKQAKNKLNAIDRLVLGVEQDGYCI